MPLPRLGKGVNSILRTCMAAPLLPLLWIDLVSLNWTPRYRRPGPKLDGYACDGNRTAQQLQLAQTDRTINGNNPRRPMHVRVGSLAHVRGPHIQSRLCSVRSLRNCYGSQNYRSVICLLDTVQICTFDTPGRTRRVTEGPRKSDCGSGWEWGRVGGEYVTLLPGHP